MCDMGAGDHTDDSGME